MTPHLLAPTVMLALLLLPVIPAQSGTASKAASSTGHVNRVRRIPTCERLLSGLSAHEIAELRDWTQHMGQHTRKWSFFIQLWERKSQPLGSLTEQYAYNTSLSLSELDGLAQKEDKMSGECREKVDSMKLKLQGTGRLPPDTDTIQLCMCVYGATNTELYEGRPKVSLLIGFDDQSFSSVDVAWPHLEKLLNASDTAAWGPAELVLSIPFQAQPTLMQSSLEWLQLGYKSKGRVIPVIGYGGLQPTVVYNRLAGIARGDSLLLMPLGRGELEEVMSSVEDFFSTMEESFSKWPELGMLGFGLFTSCHLESHLSPRNMTDPSSRQRTLFVPKVDSPPVAFRRTAFQHLTGFHHISHHEEECQGRASLADLSTRLWVSGWQVAVSVKLDGRPLHAPGQNCSIQEEGSVREGVGERVGHAHSGRFASKAVLKEICDVAEKLHGAQPDK